MKRSFKDKLIAEALDFYKLDSLLDDDDDMDFDDDDMDFDMDDDDMDFDDDDMDFDMDDDDMDFDMDDDDMDFDDEDMDFDMDDEEDENPDKAGLIRPVKGAYLVYKRVTPNNNYEELWVYNIGNVKSQTRIRNAILAGTDIDPVDLRSPDNEQAATTWSKGNVQYLHIDGLPN